MNKFSITKLVEEVRKLATEFPNNVYSKIDGEKCNYVTGICSNGTEGCIFGQAMQRMGIDIAKLKVPDADFSPYTMAINTIMDLNFELLNKEDNDPYWWCVKFQQRQDKKLRWGKCLEAVKELYPTV